MKLNLFYERKAIGNIFFSDKEGNKLIHNFRKKANKNWKKIGPDNITIQLSSPRLKYLEIGFLPNSNKISNMTIQGLQYDSSKSYLLINEKAIRKFLLKRKLKNLKLSEKEEKK